MGTLGWIIASGVLMSLLALVGGLMLVLPDSTLRRILIPLVAFSAGSLIGGAFFHMIPASVEHLQDTVLVSVLVVAGFTVFFVLEQFLHWHQCHNPKAEPRHKPLAYLILIGDGLHNLIGGLAVAGAFLIDIRVGIASWLAAAAHEIPQELGDFGVLVHGGMTKRRALFFNFLSALLFLVGGLITYAASQVIDTSWLVPFAAGNFLYIGASDLIPEVHRHSERTSALGHLAAFLAGLALLFLARAILPH